MIILHVDSKIPSPKLEQSLKDLVIAYQKVEHDQEEKKLPYIEEDGEIYATNEEVKAWLEELDSQLEWSRNLSGDGCYINPKDGKVC